MTEFQKLRVPLYQIPLPGPSTFFQTRPLARTRGGPTPMPWPRRRGFIGPGGAQPLLRHASPSPKSRVFRSRGQLQLRHTRRARVRAYIYTRVTAALLTSLPRVADSLARTPEKCIFIIFTVSESYIRARVHSSRSIDAATQSAFNWPTTAISIVASRYFVIIATVVDRARKREIRMRGGT